MRKSTTKNERALYIPDRQLLKPTVAALCTIQPYRFPERWRNQEQPVSGSIPSSCLPKAERHLSSTGLPAPSGASPAK